MSHELRTPMNAILGMTDLALGEQLPATVRDYLQTSKESADLLLELLNEILDFSRIEAGRFELESTPFSLRRTVEQVVKTLGMRAYEKGLELVCQVADELPDAVVGDPLRLRQVLMNLVSNAIKFTPKGEVVVRVEHGPSALGLGTQDLTARSPRPKTQVPRPKPHLNVALRFSVSDTGIGIAAEKLEQIFAPFTQADSSTTPAIRRHRAGSGHLATAGQLDGRADPGRKPAGRRQHVPLHPDPADCRAMRTMKARLTAGDQDIFRGLPALVIGESATSRKILQQTLASWSMRVDEAPDVPTGLTKIHEAAAAGRAYRVVLADAVMPGIDGFTLVGWLQQDPRLAGAVILMLSATDRQNYPDQCRELKTPCLEKPVSRSALFNAIAKAIGAEGAAPLIDARQDRGGLAGPQPNPSRAGRGRHSGQPEARPSRAGKSRPQHRRSPRMAGRPWNWFRQQDFDVVLMDVQMPEMDGFQATAAIRKLDDPKKARLPIIAMTAHALKGDRERCLAAGMDCYLSKPIKGEELIEMVERLAEGADLGSDFGFQISN